MVILDNYVGNGEVSKDSWRAKPLWLLAPTLVILMSLGLSFLPQKAYAQSGVGLTIGGGINSCMASGNAKCGKVESSLVLLLAPGMRMTEFLGVYLDLSYGDLRPTGEGSDEFTMTTTTLMPTFRVFQKMGPETALFGGFGVGYSSLTTEAIGMKSTWSSLGNFKVNFGMEVASFEFFEVGFNVDYIIQRGGDVCFSGFGAASDCRSVSEIENEQGKQFDMNNLLQVTGFCRFHF